MSNDLKVTARVAVKSDIEASDASGRDNVIAFRSVAEHFNQAPESEGRLIRNGVLMLRNLLNRAGADGDAMLQERLTEALERMPARQREGALASMSSNERGLIGQYMMYDRAYLNLPWQQYTALFRALNGDVSDGWQWHDPEERQDFTKRLAELSSDPDNPAGYHLAFLSRWLEGASPMAMSERGGEFDAATQHLTITQLRTLATSPVIHESLHESVMRTRPQDEASIFSAGAMEQRRRAVAEA